MSTRLAPPGRHDGSLGITDEEFDHDRAGVLADQTRLSASGRRHRHSLHRSYEQSNI